jgi:hypothetical protein
MSYLVLHVRPYSFKDDSDRTVEGATITYLDLGNDAEPGELGHAPLSISATLDQLRDFTNVPGFYDMNFKQVRGAKGRPRLVFADATLTQAVVFKSERSAAA